MNYYDYVAYTTKRSYIPSEYNIYNTHDTTINYYLIIYIQHINILVTITTELLTTVLLITNSYGAH